MNERRWTEPESDAPGRVRTALAAYDAEPTPESRARGWARLREAREPERPRRVWRTAALAGGGMAGAVLAAAIIMVVGGREPADLTVVEVDREVLGTKGPLAAGQRLQAPAVVRVGLGGRAVLETSAGDTLRVGPAARVEVRGEPSVLVDLTSGTVEVEATPRKDADRLTVVAGPWRVIVVGTRFSVERRSDDQIRVEVREGRVRVVGPDHDDQLGPGEAFDSQPPMPAEPTEQVELPPPPPANQPTERTPPRRKRVDRRAAPMPNPVPSAPDKAPELTPAEEQAVWLEQAEQTDSLDARIEALERAASFGPPLDEVASYRAARALHDAERFAAAAERYAEVIARWPAGELTQVAHVDRVECLLANGAPTAARAAEQDFIDAYPAAATLPQVVFLRAEVARALHEHAQAANFYARAARTDRYAESAGFLAALSYARAGEVAKARDMMRVYLEEFPKGAHADAARRALEEDAP